jgi:hypothetical protein
MFLYKVECQVPKQKLQHVIVLADDDLKAFEAAERLVKQQSITSIEITETVIVEKKPAKAGAGFVIANGENAENE